MNTKQQYRAYCKPKLTDLLSALKLDTHVVAAEGNYIKGDDDRNILTSVSMALEAEGFAVRTFTDGDSWTWRESLTSLCDKLSSTQCSRTQSSAVILR